MVINRWLCHGLTEFSSLYLLPYLKSSRKSLVSAQSSAALCTSLSLVFSVPTIPQILFTRKSSRASAIWLVLSVSVLYCIESVGYDNSLTFVSTWSLSTQNETQTKKMKQQSQVIGTSFFLSFLYLYLLPCDVGGGGKRICSQPDGYFVICCINWQFQIEI